MLIPSIQIETDLARYCPGQPVHILVSGPKSAGSQVRFRVYHLGKQVGRDRLKLWTGYADEAWNAPATGAHGYLAVAQVESAPGEALRAASCGIDVSSKWTDFPRYGYLSHFGAELSTRTAEILAKLNRFHIDGLQFYDWQWKHHRPLSPESSWHDIANRETSAQTVSSFVREAHERKIACMAYNLGYGAADGFQTDGLSPSWQLYDNPSARKPYALNMPVGWATRGLYFFDPGNPAWGATIFPREKAAIEKFGFDGWHMDQVGDPGPKYTATGEKVDLRTRFPALLSGAKQAVPGSLIFNDVGGYGLEETLRSPVDAMYVEVWEGNGQKTYADLKRMIDRMRSGGKAAIMPAYMNYDLAKTFDGKPPGSFNMPGVLLTDATIFASGGFHLELGDEGKMLCHEYFPNHNLEPPPALLETLRHYYDFLVAYEDILSAPGVKPADVRVETDARIWTIARKCGDQTIIHLINIANPETEPWRDPHGTHPIPQTLRNVRVSIPGKWHSAFVATPDDGLGTAHAVAIRDGAIIVPRLDYWTMIVLSHS